MSGSSASGDDITFVADDVTFRYGAGPELGPLRLALGPGLRRLSGANGAGKSTLLRCLSGDLEPTRGQVRVSAAIRCARSVPVR